MFVFDEAVVDIKNSQLISKIKRQVINEVSKEIILVWNTLNLPVRLEKNVQRNVVTLVEDLDEIKQNRHQLNRSGIEVIRGKYNELFDISQKEVANSNKIPLIANDAMETDDMEAAPLPEKRAIKRPAKYQEFFDDGSYFEALSVADQCADDADWSPDEIDAISEPDYDKYKLYIEMGERFNWSSYQIALGANALFIGLGLTHLLLTQGKVIRLKILFGREKIAAHKLRGPMLGLQVDAKEVIEALPNCKSHKTNMLTMVRLPENEYEDHFKADGDTGEIVAEGCIDIIDDTNSKDEVIVTGSDGAGNNTSPDTGTHVRIERHCGRPLQRAICNKHTGGNIFPYSLHLLLNAKIKEYLF